MSLMLICIIADIGASAHRVAANNRLVVYGRQEGGGSESPGRGTEGHARSVEGDGEELGQHYRGRYKLAFADSLGET